MTSKRNLKKQVKNICGNLAVECIIAKNTIENVNPDVMCDIVLEIAHLQTLTLRRISVSFEKGAKNFESLSEYKKARHEYVSKAFSSLMSDFNKTLSEIIKKMNNALPIEFKESRVLND